MYKICPTCKKIWKTKTQFDDSVESGEFKDIGVQTCCGHDEITLNLYVHSDCMTTLAVPRFAA